MSWLHANEHGRHLQKEHIHPLKPSLLQAKHAQFPQELLIALVLQFPTILMTLWLKSSLLSVSFINWAGGCDLFKTEPALDPFVILCEKRSFAHPWRAERVNGRWWSLVYFPPMAVPRPIIRRIHLLKAPPHTSKGAQRAQRHSDNQEAKLRTQRKRYPAWDHLSAISGEPQPLCQGMTAIKIRLYWNSLWTEGGYCLGLVGCLMVLRERIFQDCTCVSFRRKTQVYKREGSRCFEEHQAWGTEG